MSVALLWGLLAAITFGLGDLLTRLGVRNGTPFTGAIISTSIICAFFAALLLIGGVTPGPLWPAVGWFILTGVAATAPARILFYYSMRRIGVSRATILILISPLLSLLYAVILLGERPSWAAIVGAFVVIGGVASVVADRSGIRMSPRAIGLGILPTLFMGFTLIFIRLGMQALPDAVLGSGVSSFSALLTLLALQKSISPEERWGAEWKGMKFFLIGGVCYCGAFYTYHKVLEFAEVSFAAPLVFSSPLFSIALSRLFLQSLERVTWRLAIGAAIVFVGIYLVSISEGG